MHSFSFSKTVQEFSGLILALGFMFDTSALRNKPCINAHLKIVSNNGTVYSCLCKVC